MKIKWDPAYPIAGCTEVRLLREALADAQVPA